jgi:hypothetical protein
MLASTQFMKPKWTVSNSMGRPLWRFEITFADTAMQFEYFSALRAITRLESLRDGLEV